MRDANGVYFLLSDHLGSSSVVIDESGQIVESGYYLPWGGQRGDEGITATDYGYTGQMKEDDIYYYNARWPQVPEAQRVGFDPDISRFMQADSIVPLQVQGTQAFDRYAYVNNNPVSPPPACDYRGFPASRTPTPPRLPSDMLHYPPKLSFADPQPCSRFSLGFLFFQYSFNGNFSE